MKKPLPVKIVEALGWTYVALSVLGLFCALVGVASASMKPFDCILLCLFCLVPIVVLSVGMLVSLRHGRRGWFIVPNTLLFALLSAGLILDLLDHHAGGFAIALVASLLLLIVPLVLLYLPSSAQWFKEKTEEMAGANGRLSCLVGCVTFLMALALLAIMFSPARGRMINGMVHLISIQCRELFWCMAHNNMAHEFGEEWLDPARCTNSTQFVQLLREKYGKELVDTYGRELRDTNIWCIAVNPPDDDAFPLIFTCNIDPRELLSQAEGNRNLTRTCPKAWGGTCFRFCEKAVVIVRAGGAAQMIVKDKYFSPNRIFPNGIPKPGPDTYFLTPTGRVDFVERQAADWLSIHEFASNDDSGDVSVKWRVAWPESLSGLNNEGLSSVRREILQMTFGPAWSDLNHGDKTWVPPPTIEEAEEEIKRKLEEPDIVWEFSGDVELDRPFGASLQDGAEWYARPVIAAKNDGNSSFRRECGCTYYTIARTFSIPDGREMTVDDYFDRGKMKELSALVWRRLLESVFPSDDEARKDMGERDINLRDRNLIFIRVMSGGICFYFAPYSIFSGAEGVTKAFLKWGELSKFRKK